jgi:hypothetical protein
MTSRWTAISGRYSESQFALFRVLFGAYLFQHFVLLIPHAAEVFSREGMLPSVDLNPTSRIFPNLLGVVDSPSGVQVWLSLLAALSGCLAAGLWQRPVSLALWYGFACLFNRNVLISNPSLGFVGWLLLLLALVPAGNRWSLFSKRSLSEVPPGPWQLSPVLYWGAWFLLALGYTASGLHKLSAPSWRDGSALSHVLSIPLARDVPWREWILSLDPVVVRVLTWSALAAEILYLPLAYFERTRLLAWLSMVLMHLGILCVISFAELSFGMLLVHAFVFDPKWLRAREN